MESYDDDRIIMGHICTQALTTCELGLLSYSKQHYFYAKIWSMKINITIVLTFMLVFDVS